MCITRLKGGDGEHQVPYLFVKVHHFSSFR